jgi:hypothetical protein
MAAAAIPSPHAWTPAWAASRLRPFRSLLHLLLGGMRLDKFAP